MFIARTLVATVLLAAAVPAFAEHAKSRLQEASKVVNEMIGETGSGIPEALLRDAKCAIVIPGAKKGGFFLGAEYGRGFALCRQSGTARGWGAPAAVRMEGGSIGLQIGAAETDIFMLVMSDSAMKPLLESKFTLDANAGLAAGPVGLDATAATDASLRTGILAWSKSKGAFAGLTLGGGTLRQDLDENEELYGKRLSNKEILLSNMKAPAAATPLVSALNRFQRQTEGTRAREKK